MHQREYSWLTQDGLRLHAVEWKPDGDIKAAVVLVHGIGEHTGRYQHVAEFLTSSGYALSGFDLRGHGKSEGLRGHTPSFEVTMRDITQQIKLTRENIPGYPIFLYGHSMGANLVLYYSMTRDSNPSGIIATAPGLDVVSNQNPLKVTLGKLVNGIVPTLRLQNGLDRSGLSRDLEVVQKYISDPLVHPWVSARTGMELIFSGKYILEHPQEMKSPLLLMQGTEDRLVSPEVTRRFAQTVPAEKITYMEWEGYYHELHNEPEKELVLSQVVNWLDKF